VTGFLKRLSQRAAGQTGFEGRVTLTLRQRSRFESLPLTWGGVDPADSREESDPGHPASPDEADATVSEERPARAPASQATPHRPTGSPVGSSEVRPFDLPSTPTDEASTTGFDRHVTRVTDISSADRAPDADDAGSSVSRKAAPHDVRPGSIEPASPDEPAASRTSEPSAPEIDNQMPAPGPAAPWSPSEIIGELSVQDYVRAVDVQTPDREMRSSSIAEEHPTNRPALEIRDPFETLAHRERIAPFEPAQEPFRALDEPSPNVNVSIGQVTVEFLPPPTPRPVPAPAATPAQTRGFDAYARARRGYPR
jgi:hypothetical protein